jgi:hypothetical protein
MVYSIKAQLESLSVKPGKKAAKKRAKLESKLIKALR